MDGVSCPGDNLPNNGFFSAACDPSAAVYCPADTNYSPIIIDTQNEGFHLTDVSDGVEFAIIPGRVRVRTSWTDARYHNGWLVLDRNDNGKVDDMSELFGNLTEQPKDESPNGYKALAVFDEAANGGNGNGLIDPSDSVFSRLAVWIDSNHDGESQTNELFSLSQLGIAAFKLAYKDTPKVDENGNAFKYRSSVHYASGQNNDRITYDVYLQVQKPQ
jgi:hypothetical protein